LNAFPLIFSIFFAKPYAFIKTQAQAKLKLKLVIKQKKIAISRNYYNLFSNLRKTPE